MEEHKGAVWARKSKCAVPARMSKVDAMMAGGGSIGVVAAVVAVFGVADSSLFNDNWCCTVTTNSTMAEVASPVPLPTWRDEGSNLIQLLLNLGVCLLGILHGNTLRYCSHLL